MVMYYLVCNGDNDGLGIPLQTLGGGESVKYMIWMISSSKYFTQIAGTRAEPQQIVAQRLLSCLQYPVPYLSRLQRI